MDVLIIGAGIVGLSIAYNLAEEGIKNVAVVEKDFPGSGTTGRGGGGVRHQFSTELNVKFTIESMRTFTRFKDIFGYDPELKKMNYLLLATHREEDLLKECVNMQRKLGVKTKLLDPDEIKDIAPQLNTEGITIGSICEDDIWVNPSRILQGYLEACICSGVKILENAEAKALCIEKDGSITVKTTAGRIQTEKVVNAAGPWGGLVGSMMGIDTPISPFKRQVFYLEAYPKTSVENLLIFDLHNKIAVVRRPEGLLIGIHDKSSLGSFDQELNIEDGPIVVRRVAKILPLVNKAEVTGGIAGLYELTPDRNPILGDIPNARNLFVAAGFSGHGIMHSPAVGRCMAELMIKESSPIDISRFSITRFRKKRLTVERIVI